TVVSSSPSGLYGQCRVKAYIERIDRADAERFQEWISGGHEPWRIEEADTVASIYLADFVKKHDGLPRPLERPRKELSHSDQLAIYDFDSFDSRISFRVRLRKFSWLLPAAKKWERMPWFVTKIEVVKCLPQKNEPVGK